MNLSSLKRKCHPEQSEGSAVRRCVREHKNGHGFSRAPNNPNNEGFSPGGSGQSRDDYQYQVLEISECHHHRSKFNREYEALLITSGLTLSARSSYMVNCKSENSPNFGCTTSQSILRDMNYNISSPNSSCKNVLIVQRPSAFISLDLFGVAESVALDSYCLLAIE